MWSIVRGIFSKKIESRHPHPFEYRQVKTYIALIHGSWKINLWIIIYPQFLLNGHGEKRGNTEIAELPRGATNEGRMPVSGPAWKWRRPW